MRSHWQASQQAPHRLRMGGADAAGLAASCFTGAAVIGLTTPLDCLKQRWQVEPRSAQSMAGFAQRIVRIQGLWGGLWRPGLATNVAACTCSVGTRLGLYPVIRDLLAPVTGGSQFVSGLLGGALGYTSAAPFFFATRVAHAEAGLSSRPCIGIGTMARLAADGGVRGLWRGGGVLVARGALMSGSQLQCHVRHHEIQAA